MEEQATEEQNANVNSNVEVDAKPQQEVEAKGLTVDEVRNVVTEVANTSHAGQDAAISDLGNKVSSLGEAINTLNAKQEEEPKSEDVVYVVRLDGSQVDTAKSAARVACTEGLILIILLALCCGLQAWKILAGRWSNG